MWVSELSGESGTAIVQSAAQFMARLFLKREYLMSYSPNGLEHRWGARVQMNIPVVVEATALPMGSGYLKDLSLSGAFIKSDRDLRLHTLVEVIIALTPPSSRTAVIKAHVSRKCKEGIGVEWCEFAPNIVKDLVRSASRSPP
jgi:PilZ domain